MPTLQGIDILPPETFKEVREDGLLSVRINLSREGGTMSHGKCTCGFKFPLAMNKDIHFHIGVWCGNCNQKWSFSSNVDDGQTKLWPRYFKCTCDARRFKECTCDPTNPRVV